MNWRNPANGLREKRGREIERQKQGNVFVVFCICWSHHLDRSSSLDSIAEKGRYFWRRRALLSVALVRAGWLLCFGVFGRAVVLFSALIAVVRVSERPSALFMIAMIFCIVFGLTIVLR